MSARRLIATVLVSLCGSGAGLLLWSAPALASAPPVISEEAVVNVASSSATFQALVNPEGSETTYRFEYGTSEAYGSSVPSPDGNAGAGTSALAVQAHTQTLQAHTTYHYRVLATNAAGTTDGPDQSFTTQAIGGALTLPDGRQWETVSPPVKEGGEILPDSEESLIQAAANGDAIAYTSFLSPTEPNPAGFAKEAEVLSARAAGGGWSSQDLNTPHEEPVGIVVGNGRESRFFSEDLSLELIEPFGEGLPLLSAKATERTMYVHDDASVKVGASEQALFDEAQAEALPGSQTGYLPLVTAANVPAGTKFGARFPLGVHFEGASPDLTHVVFSSPASLTQRAREVGFGGLLYEWSDGRLQLVSLGPAPGEEAMGGSLGGENGYSARNAVSADGSRIIWSSVFGAHLYLRDTAMGVTVQLDVAQGVPQPSAGGVFQIASSDGSKVFFTDGPLIPDAGAQGVDLYECEVVQVAGNLVCRLSDLTVDPHAGEGTDVQGQLLGASEDGSYVYFVANGALAEGAISGEDNLYLLHESGGQWTTTFIATLSGEDAQDWANNLAYMVARVSPDGHYLAFMSQRSLTGYDNIDANSGRADEEVYLYDALSGRLVCPSCDPSGARPVGVEAEESPKQLINDDRVWNQGTGLAADVPGWSNMSLSAARHQPRYLSDSGRLFFDGVDPLVPQAANGLANVYEYEPAEVGSCTGASTTFSAASGGCVTLISGGTSGEESAFMDASESGDDVFFLTSERLTSGDLDTAYDVYDAHVCTTAEPCPAVSVSPPACTTADSCRSAPAPQPGVFGAPVSATFAGAGNLPAPAVRPAVKGKRPKAKRKRKRARGGPTRVRRGRARSSRPRTRGLSSRTGRREETR